MPAEWELHAQTWMGWPVGSFAIFCNFTHILIFFDLFLILLMYRELRSREDLMFFHMIVSLWLDCVTLLSFLVFSWLTARLGCTHAPLEAPDSGCLLVLW